MNLTKKQLQVLELLAKKYIWWKTPQQSSLYAQKSLAHIMTSAILVNDDVDTLIDVFGANILEVVLANAEVGQFTNWNVVPNDKPWIFWHTKLGLSIKSLPDDRFRD